VFLTGQCRIQPGVTARARAAGRWAGSQPGQFIRGQARKGRKLADGVVHLGVGQAIEDVAPIAGGDHQTGFSQDHQMLRDDRLTDAQQCLHVANAGLAVGNNQQNLKPHRLAQQVEKIR